MPDLTHLEQQLERIKRVESELEERLQLIQKDLTTTLTDEQRLLLEMETLKKQQMLNDLQGMKEQVQRDIDKETICPVHQSSKFDCKKNHNCL